MTTTNALSALLQNYSPLQTQGSLAALARQLASSVSAQTSGTSSTGKTDTATISNEAIQALLASEQQGLSGDGSADPWGLTTGLDPTASTNELSSASGINPATETPQQMIQQAQWSMFQAEQSLLGSDSSATTNGESQQSDDLTSLMTTYTQDLSRQAAEAIQATETRLAKGATGTKV